MLKKKKGSFYMDIERNVVLYKTEEEWLSLRAPNINSTEVSALFGLNPYLTSFALWHRKKNKLTSEGSANEAMQWGKTLESAIAGKIAKDNDWIATPARHYISCPAKKIGSSFDFFCQKPNSNVRSILEIKNVMSLSRSGWSRCEDGSFEAPAHIELQIQHQLLLSGLKKAYIGALISGNKAIVIEREPVEIVQKEILEKISEFWESIEGDRPPKPDYDRDSKFIIDLNQSVSEGKVMDFSENSELNDSANEYKIITKKINALSKKKEELKAKILESMGDASRAIGPDCTVSTAVVAEREISFKRKSYRSFKVSFKEGSKDEAKI